MPIPAPRSAHSRRRDVNGAHIALFCWVEQVKEGPEPGVLPSPARSGYRPGPRIAPCALFRQCAGQPATPPPVPASRRTMRVLMPSSTASTGWTFLDRNRTDGLTICGNDAIGVAYVLQR